MSSNVKALIAVAVLVLVAGGTVASLWVTWPPGGEREAAEGEVVVVELAAGGSAARFADDAAAGGVVRSSRALRNELTARGLDRRMRPGRYELLTGMSVEAVADLVAQGPREAERVTVVEGRTAAEAVADLGRQLPDLASELTALADQQRAAMRSGQDGPLRVPAGWTVADEAVDPLEGLLWPATYDLPDTAGAAEVLQLLLDEFAAQTAGVARADLVELATVASLVERETQVDGERAEVAGVIAGRVSDGMRLQIDATVQYARGVHVGRLLHEDLEVDSPYNTYRTDGLPPGPISNFGRASLDAAAQPADTTSRFYVLDPACDGSHRFADTYDEHLVNVEAFQQRGRCGLER